MTVVNKSLKQIVTEKFVRIVIVIVGLLVLRGILSVMPMLRNDPIYTVSWRGVPLYRTDTPLTIDAFLGMLSSEQNRTQLQWLADEIQQEQIRLSRENAAAGPGFALKTQNEILIDSYLAIFPITIAKGVVDTMIFAALLLFALNFAQLFRARYARLPDFGLMVSLCIVTAVIAMAYHFYQGLAYPFLFPDNYSIYGWVFVVLVLLPLIGLGVVVARNMNTITALVMQSGSSLAASSNGDLSSSCSRCGQSIPAGVKFCGNCGAAAAAPLSQASARSFCPSCGTENPSATKYCKECGHAM